MPRLRGVCCYHVRAEGGYLQTLTQTSASAPTEAVVILGPKRCDRTTVEVGLGLCAGEGLQPQEVETGVSCLSFEERRRGKHFNPAFATRVIPG